MSYMRQNKKHKQTLESAQYGLGISFKDTKVTKDTDVSSCKFIPWSIIAVFLFIVWHSTSCNSGFCLYIHYFFLVFVTSHHLVLPQLLRNTQLFVSSRVDLVHRSSYVWIWMKVKCYPRMRNDSMNKDVIASNVVFIRKQFCKHSKNLKNLGKTFQRIGKQWLSFFKYLSDVLQSCSKSRGFKNGKRGTKDEVIVTGIKWERGCTIFALPLQLNCRGWFITFVCLCSFKIVRKRPQGMPVIPFIKFPTNVEYLVFILLSEGKTNRQTCHKMLFLMSKALTQRTPFDRLLNLTQPWR